MQRAGIEWLYRLVKEPWRWRRQTALIGFALTVLWHKLRPRPAMRELPNTVCASPDAVAVEGDPTGSPDRVREEMARTHGAPIAIGWADTPRGIEEDGIQHNLEK